jgi:hypothetical protein
MRTVHDQPQKSKPKRRWRVVSVRTMMLLVLLAAVPFAWIARRLYFLQVAKDTILRHDGAYFYEHEPQSGSSYIRSQRVPHWLQRLLGADLFHDITLVRIEGNSFSDSELPHLAALDRVTSLGIEGTAITDQGLKHFRGNKHVQHLWLGGNKIGDAGIDQMHLEEMPQLQLLELRSTLVSAAKRAEIRLRFPKLMLLDSGEVVRMIDPSATRDQRLK